MSLCLWIIYKGEGDLHRKLRKGYTNDPKVKMFPDEFRKFQVLKDIKMVNGLL
jgi:hypothetical protein